MDTIRYQLKIINRQYGLYSKTKISMKNNLISLLDQTYPGVNALFSSSAREDISQKWVDFTTSFWYLDYVRSLSLTTFTQSYQKWCKWHGYKFSNVKATKIHEGTKNQIAMLPKDTITKLLIRQAIEQLKSTSMTVELLRAEMNRLAEQLPEYPVVMVMAISGVGKSLGPQLIAEIGDMTRFTNKSSLAAYAGVDPSVNQFGTHESKSTASSKTGSPELRKTLFLVMSALLQTTPAHDPVFQFLNKKRAEGKFYYVYMTAGANKFLRVYHGRVKKPFLSLALADRLISALTISAGAFAAAFLCYFFSSCAYEFYINPFLTFYL